MEAIRPPALKPGDVIGVAATASAFDREKLQRGVGWLSARGFRIRYAPGLFERHHYLAGTARQRADGLHALASDEEVCAILCARGGYGTMQVLELLDWSLLGARPRIFVGYSDMTPLLWSLRQRTKVVAFHGPVVSGLVDNTDEASRAHLLEALCRWERPPAPLSGGTTLTPGVVEAEAVGGNLTMVAATLGTPWQVDATGRILLLEDVGERPYRVDRVLTQLRLAGVLSEVAGIAAGTFSGCDEPGGGGRDILEILAEAVDGLGIPVCAGLPFGHDSANRLIPIGVPCRLDASAGRLEVLEPVVGPPDAQLGAT